MASRTTPLVSSILRRVSAQPIRARPLLANYLQPRRAGHTIPRPVPRKPSKEASRIGDPPKSEGKRPDVKHAYYQLSFTCVPCGHRSHHNVSKQGYHHGSTLITCSSCRNRHVISDHLNIFGDRKITVEDLMREKGQLVKRGSLGEDGDIEFWPENSLDGENDAPGQTESVAPGKTESS